MMAMVLGMASVGGAQQPPPSESQLTPPPSTEVVDPAKLGIDLKKVQKALNQEVTKEHSEVHGLRINLHIEVFGTAPSLNLFENFDPVAGPVPFGAPTHKDFLDMVTPQEFRAPVANFSALAFWAIRKLQDRNERERCEEELARYRSEVMAGRPVAAPTCAR